MRRIIGLGAVVALLLATPASAEITVRLNVRLDISDAHVSAFSLSRQVAWHGAEGELAGEWSKRKLFLNGFAFGIRKEGQYYSDGTYFTLRTFTQIPLGGRYLGLYPSIGVVYGLPGLPMMRVMTRDGAWIFPVRTIDIPGTEVKSDGVLYPELSVALRLKVWRFNIEPLAGVRYIRFGTQLNGRYSDGRVLVPTAGVRVGFKLASAN